MCDKVMVWVSVVAALGGMAGIASAVDLKVDIGATGQAVKAGWTQWSEERLEGAPPSAQKSFGGITVSLTQSGGDALAFRNGDGGELTSDLVCINNHSGNPAMTMTISGLADGYYAITTYHNYIFDTTAVLDIWVDGALKVSGLAVTLGAGNDDSAASATYEFTASGDVVIEFTSTNGANVPLDGFHLQRAPTTLEFESAASAGTESISPASLTVLLKNAEEGQTYTVDYAVTGGTATGGGVDYSLAGACNCDLDDTGQVSFSDLARLADNWLSQTPDNIADVTGDNSVNFKDFAACALEWLDICGSTTLQFEPGETIKTIPIDIVDDGIAEGEETIEVTLSSPTGPDVQLGAIATHTYTIREAPPTVSFAAGPSGGQEFITPVMIAVNLSHASINTITVDYAVSGGTATGGEDYTLADGTLQFDPGEVSQHISIEIVDDTITEADETIELTLSNPTNAALGPKTQHTYSIVDNEHGVFWDGLAWYYSGRPTTLFVNDDGDLEWPPVRLGQFITRIPEQRLSQAGDVVEVSYMWMTDGAHDCPDCFDCGSNCWDDDITCIAGTSDMRVGLFEADGEYVESDGLGTGDDIFVGYKGYNFRFGPNMRSGPTRWVDCHDEVHKTGQFAKKPADSSSLLSKNTGLMDAIPGFELPPGQYSLFTIRLQRTSSSSVRMSITLNGRTYSHTDDSGSDQPQKIDVLAVHMRNGRPYTRLVLRSLDKL